MELRELPSVDELLRTDELAAASPCRRRERRRGTRWPRRASADRRRGRARPTSAAAALELAARAAAPRLRRAINATGVVLHTNLGRAPLASAALEHACEVARGYSNLEYDLQTGERGSRHDHLAPTLRTLDRRRGRARRQQQRSRAAARPGCAGRGARGDRLARRADRDRRRVPHPRRARALGGAPASRSARRTARGRPTTTLAVGPDTALLLRVHQSNFRTVGFTERPRLAQLAAVAGRHGLPLVDDLGSGSLVAFADEPLVPESLAAGADLVCFSGDKLLGGPQAGILAGSAELVGRLRRHPLQRALRPDKLTLAALEGTLLLYLDPARALARRAGPAQCCTSRWQTFAPAPSDSPDWSAVRRSRRPDAPAAARCRSPRAAERRVRGRRRARASPPPRRAAGRERRPRGPDAARLPDDRRRRGRRARARRGRSPRPMSGGAPGLRTR